MFTVAAADIDSIAQTLDFDALQDNITNIAFCDIEQELVCTPCCLVKFANSDFVFWADSSWKIIIDLSKGGSLV